MTAAYDSAECKLAITFKGSVMNVREESLCTSGQKSPRSGRASQPRRGTLGMGPCRAVLIMD